MIILVEFEMKMILVGGEADEVEWGEWCHCWVELISFPPVFSERWQEKHAWGDDWPAEGGGEAFENIYVIWE